MFGWSLVKTDRLWELELKEIKLRQSNRWLAEFDWLLIPFWKYMDGEYSKLFGAHAISAAREDMRKRLETRKEAK